MKLSAEVVRIAKKIQNELDREKENLRLFSEKFDREYSGLRIDHVDVAITYIDKSGAKMLGQAVQVKTTHCTRIK